MAEKNTAAAAAPQTNPAEIGNFETIQEFCERKKFIHVNNAVGESVKNVPFVTFINEDNEAENVYFSRNASATTGVGETVDQAFLEQYRIGVVTYPDGETRTKLITKGGNRVVLSWD